MATANKKTEKAAKQESVLMKYQNKRTGAILESVCVISGPDWKQIGGPKGKQEKDPEEDPENEEDTEDEE